MKYSLNQVKKYVPEISSIPVEELIARIWASIAEVENVEYLSKKYEGVIVARVEKIEKHPRSEKLVVATVDIGKKTPVTVVTAAHNLDAGDFVPYIPVGGRVLDVHANTSKQIEITVRVMAGIDSIGMLASEKELELSEDHEGIMILRQNELKHELVAGEPIVDALDLDDVIFEIENKSLTHRGDCLSIAGISREIATLYSFDLVLPVWQTPSVNIADMVGDAFQKEPSAIVTVEVAAKPAVERYSTIVLDNVQVTPSPLWLRIYLGKHGFNSVNNIVDITNYVMIEYGQPMHAFDASTVIHKTRNEKITYPLIVRYAQAGETILTLDGKEKKLPQMATVIADEKKALAIAGIIGGQESAISETSTRIILESAVFNKYAIRNTSMSIGTTTDASVIFSRKQDPEKTVRALLRAVHLLTELAGAKVVSDITDIYSKTKITNTLIVSHEKVEAFLGIAVSPTKIVQILEGLGCQVVKKNNLYRMETPTWRPDIAIDEDVYEEIARMVGYGNIIPELPKRGIFGVSLSPYEKGKQATLRAFTALGINQGMNFSFVSKQLYERCLLSMNDARSVINAISPDVQYMRKHLIPGLLEQFSKNQYNSEKFGLFELGKVSRKGLHYTGISVEDLHMPESRFGIDDLGLPIEDEHVAIGIIDDSQQPGYFTLKEVITRYAESMHILLEFIHPDELTAKEVKQLPTWATELFPLYKKGRMAVVRNAGTKDFYGVIGEPGTLVLKEFGFTKQVAIAELSLYKIISTASFEPLYKEPPKFPIVTEDLCFEVPLDVQYAAILKVLTEVSDNFVQDVVIRIYPIDIYQKKEDKKQVTNRVVFAPIKASLSDSQIKKYREQFITGMLTLKGKLV
ncbi:phenylalanine--tRNA ligase subunit beta [bacterium]|nr:phenylalanine--tRNA ligase subunit beta [bacterium]